MLTITQGRGFQMTFANGHRLSVQFGAWNYCARRKYDAYGTERTADMWESPNAEIAVFDPAGNFLHIAEADDVIGHVPTMGVVAIIAIVSAPDFTGSEEQLSAVRQAASM